MRRIKQKMKERLISTIRIGVALLIGFLVTWLGTANLLDHGTEAQLLGLVETLSVVIGTIVYYFAARLLEDRFPWLLGPKFPRRPQIILRSNRE
jgi:uncharacterized membrane protein (DUF485 family)